MLSAPSPFESWSTSDPPTPPSVPLSRLEEWARSEAGVALYGADGFPVEEPARLLQEAQQEGTALDHDLVISSEVAAALGLGALWYRLRVAPSETISASLLPTGELAHLLEMLAPELEETSLLVCDPLGRVAAANGSAQSLLGYLAGGLLLGRSLEELLGRRGLLQPMEPTACLFELPAERRETLPVQVSIMPYRDVSGRASGWLVRLTPRPFLAANQVDWQSMVEHFPGIVMRIEPDGRVLYANRRVGSWTFEEISSLGVFGMIREDALVTAHHFRDLVVHGQTSLTGEIPVYDPRSEETIWYSFSAVPVVRDGNTEVLIFATDISLRKQAQQDLRISQDQVRELTSRLDRAQEQERRRISRELHDELGGMLTALRLDLGSLERVDGLPPEAREKIESVEHILGLTMSTVRRLSTQLRPQILDDLGLSAALESMMTEAGRRCSFDYDLQLPRSLPGEPELHLHLFRICQEALTNICRHAGATTVKLRITRPFRNRLDLLIEDDGVGYHPQQVARKRTLGLSGIAERVQLLGGKLSTTSSPGHGCQIKIQLPLRPLRLASEEDEGLVGE